MFASFQKLITIIHFACIHLTLEFANEYSTLLFKSDSMSLLFECIRLQTIFERPFNHFIYIYTSLTIESFENKKSMNKTKLTEAVTKHNKVKWRVEKLFNEFNLFNIPFLHKADSLPALFSPDLPPPSPIFAPNYLVAILILLM